ncbi:hypothetical protein PMAYCL1PPCAC_21342 [Pristionchus mayeri]|uniref:G protein-coupled receptor n=1 Tax=Pristionchus mayeri TaxID=1317129 RepID=A0AAN5I3X0_9BILA|nr:hypothetical protein PMAYCL1PPCAC_21342 [Pristionchus mayeri]
MSDLETCLREGFNGPTLTDRLTVGIPMVVFTAIGLHLNIVLWRIITIQKGMIDLYFLRHVICLTAANVGTF